MSNNRLISEISRLSIAAQSLQSLGEYRGLLQAAGFSIVSEEDLTASWGAILAERLAMYRKLVEEAERAGTPSGDKEFTESYARFVGYVQARKLGGIRFAAQKPG